MHESFPSEPFGRAWRREWQFDPAVTYLNHGTVGAPPRRVIEAQRRIQDDIERQPSRYLLRELSAIRVGVPTDAPGRLRSAASVVGRFLGADGDDLVLIDNATAGANVVARSLALSPSDEVIVTTLGYGGLSNGVAAAVRDKGARLLRLDLPFPLLDPTLVVELIDAALTPRTRLVVVDHITSESAIILPVAEIARRCHERSVMVLVDGAHAPGNIALDIGSLGVDFYTANLHKWAWAPRSVGILWARRDHQPRLHPPVVSWGLDQGFTTEFDWVGTRDPSAWLTTPFAIELMASIGLDRILDANHALAWRAGRHLAEQWRTSLDTPEALIGSMITVPLPAKLGSTAEDAARLRDSLLADDRIEVQLHAWEGRLWTRVSAQIYNDMSDIDALDAAIGRRLGSQREG